MSKQIDLVATNDVSALQKSTVDHAVGAIAADRGRARVQGRRHWSRLDRKNYQKICSQHGRIAIIGADRPGKVNGGKLCETHEPLGETGRENAVKRSISSLRTANTKGHQGMRSLNCLLAPNAKSTLRCYMNTGISKFTKRRFRIGKPRS